MLHYIINACKPIKAVSGIVPIQELLEKERRLLRCLTLTDTDFLDSVASLDTFYAEAVKQRALYKYRCKQHIHDKFWRDMRMSVSTEIQVYKKLLYAVSKRSAYNEFIKDEIMANRFELKRQINNCI